MALERTRMVGLLASVGAILLGLPTLPAQAEPLNSSTQLLAQRVRNYCRSEESLFLSLETKSFWINICGGDNPNTYVGVEKRNPRRRIRLPLKDYDPQGTYFEAVNRDFTYILAQTPKGKFLTVSQGTRELLREPILKGW